MEGRKREEKRSESSETNYSEILGSPSHMTGLEKLVYKTPAAPTSWAQTLEALTPRTSERHNPPHLEQPPELTKEALEGDGSRNELGRQLAYVSDLLKQPDLTPASKRNLKEYQQLLEEIATGKRTAVTAFDLIKQKRDSLINHEHYRRNASAQTKHLQLLLVRYQKLELFARYGDYLQDQTGEIKKKWIEEAKAAGVKPDVLVEKLWTEISNDMQREKGLPKQPAREGVHRAADALGWEREYAEFCVHEYAKRNYLMHADIYDLVSKQNWQKIGERCQSDLQVIRKVFDPSEDEQKRLYEQTITEFRDRFVRRQGSEGWIPIRPIYIATTEEEELNTLSDIKIMAALGHGATEEDIRAKMAELMRKKLPVDESIKEASRKKANSEKELKKQLKEKERELEALKKIIADLETKQEDDRETIQWYRNQNVSNEREIQTLRSDNEANQLELEKLRIN